MTDKKEVLKKLAKARQQIKENPISKSGSNNGRNYFTPSQVSNLISSAIKDNGLFNKFDLLKNEELGTYGQLEVFDIESGQSIIFKQLTEMSDLKGGANNTQKFGSTVTYSYRYLLTNAYDIAENDVDPDAQSFKEKGNLNEFKARIHNAKSKDELKKIWTDLEKDITIKEWEQNAVTLLQTAMSDKSKEFDGGK